MYRRAAARSLVAAAVLSALGARAHAEEVAGVGEILSHVDALYTDEETCNPPRESLRDLGGYHLTAVPIVWVKCSTPALGTYVWVEPQRRLLPARDRTHRAWLEPAALADPSTAVTTLEGGHRLGGAPAIPVAFLRRVDVQFLGVPLSERTGSGGSADVLVRHGDSVRGTRSMRRDRESVVGEARIVVDHARGDSGAAFELLAGAPIAKRAAFASGLVLEPRTGDRLGVHGMAAVDYAPSAAQELALIAMSQTTRDGLRDTWTSARWAARTEHGLAVRAIATVERLSSTITSATTTRAGAQVDVVWRTQRRTDPDADPETDPPAWLRGVTVSASGGGGVVDGERHGDAALAAGAVVTRDAESDVALEAGVRGELRTIAGERAAVVAPRVALALFRESRRKQFDAFVAYQRVPHLDDGALGAWRTLDALAHHEVAVGGTYLRLRNASFMLGASAAVRATSLALDGDDPELGAYMWLRLESQKGGGTWPWLFVSATTFGRVAAMTGQHRLVRRGQHRLFAGATARVSPDRAIAGAALQWWHHSGSGDVGRLGATLEAHTGDGAQSIRLSVEVTR